MAVWLIEIFHETRTCVLLIHQRAAPTLLSCVSELLSLWKQAEQQLWPQRTGDKSPTTLIRLPVTAFTIKLCLRNKGTYHYFCCYFKAGVAFHIQCRDFIRFVIWSTFRNAICSSAMRRTYETALSYDYRFSAFILKATRSGYLLQLQLLSLITDYDKGTWNAPIISHLNSKLN